MEETFQQKQQEATAGVVRSMQEFDPSPGEYATVLYDERDGKEYHVKRMADGCWWMIDDLRYGTPSDISDWKENCKRDVKDLMGEGLYGVCRESLAKKGGYLYNWQAVMQHPDAAHGMYSSPNLPGQLWQGICPAGWHVPCLYEMIRLKSVLGGCFTGLDAMGCNMPGPLSWNGIYNGYCDLNGIRVNHDMFGYYWTSSANTSLDAYCLIFGNSLASPQGINGKFLGLGVRAVLDRIR